MRTITILFLSLPIISYSQNRVQASQIDVGTIGAVAEIGNVTIANLNSGATYTDYNLTTVNYNDLGSVITITSSGFVSNIEATYEVCHSVEVSSTGARATTLYRIIKSDGSSYALGSTTIRNSSGINEMSEAGCVKIRMLPTESLSYQSRREGTNTSTVNGLVKLTVERTR